MINALDQCQLDEINYDVNHNGKQMTIDKPIVVKKTRDVKTKEIVVTNVIGKILKKPSHDKHLYSAQYLSDHPEIQF